MDPNINFDVLSKEAGRVALMRRIAIAVAVARVAPTEQGPPPAWRLR